MKIVFALIMSIAVLGCEGVSVKQSDGSALQDSVEMLEIYKAKSIEAVSRSLEEEAWTEESKSVLSKHITDINMLFEVYNDIPKDQLADNLPLLLAMWNDTMSLYEVAKKEIENNKDKFSSLEWFYLGKTDELVMQTNARVIAYNVSKLGSIPTDIEDKKEIDVDKLLSVGFTAIKIASMFSGLPL